jgi:acetolactate synthase-1/2/3 large subunit
MKVYEAIGRRIAEEGTPAVFGLMGDGNLKLIPYLSSELGIAFYGARHESGAVAMADGWARVTGKVGVCTFTQGPGLTNALTALVSAQRGRTPMVVLCGDTPEAVVGLPQDIEQRPFLAAAGVPVQELRSADVVPSVAAAFRRARTERRPIALNLPTDFQELECEWVELTAELDPPAEPAPPGEAELNAAAQAISEAQRPVVIAGRGAIEAGAREEIVRFADRIGALLATSLPAKSWFDGHPFAIGIAGGFASELGRDLIWEADCVIVFGASVNHFTSRGGTLFGPGTTIVQCDLDPSAFGRYVPAQLTVTGDALTVAAALADRVPAGDGCRSDELHARIVAGPVGQIDESGPESLDPRVLSRRLDSIVPADRTLVVDGGHFMGFPSMDIAVPRPSRFVFTLDFGSIGLGLAAAVGAAVACPDRITVVAVGDGGLMMSLGELDTAVRYRLPMLVVIYNDGAYGAEMHFLRMMDLPDAESLFEVPALDEVARAMGADGLAVRTLDDLVGVPERLGAMDGPLVLDCQVSRSVRAEWLEEAFQRGTH